MGTVVGAARGVVATSQILASEAGCALLRRGGSAVDAALGANAVLSLTEPHMCGPGGDLFALVWDPASRALHGLNASGRAPVGQTLDALRERLGDAAQIPGTGVHSVTTPGAVSGWAALHARFGRLPLADVFAPVIALAEQGVPIGPITATWWQHATDALMADAGFTALRGGLEATFLPGGRAPTAGESFRNPDLAQTYRALVEDGFDSFYTGRLAARLVDYLARCDSALRAEDFARTKAEWVAPLSTSYRGHEVYELPPNGQGLSVLQMLNMLETFPLAQWGRDSADWWHAFIEVKKLAFEDRARYFADPGYAEVPVSTLGSKGYARARAALVGPSANRHPRHGDPAIARGDTTYLTVADEQGMMVSLIQSVYSGFGSGLVPDGMGFPLQCRGAGFSLDAAHPNAYAPGKRPFHTIIPAFVMKDGEPAMSLGVMGADMQPQGQVQVLVNMLDFGLDAQAAGDAARMRHDGNNHPNITRVAEAGVVWHEAGIAGTVIDELRRRGHDMRVLEHPVLQFMGGYQCIQRVDGGYVAASEPRFDGCALGY